MFYIDDIVTVINNFTLRTSDIRKFCKQWGSYCIKIGCLINSFLQGKYFQKWNWASILWHLTCAALAFLYRCLKLLMTTINGLPFLIHQTNERNELLIIYYLIINKQRRDPPKTRDWVDSWNLCHWTWLKSSV